MITRIQDWNKSNPLRPSFSCFAVLSPDQKQQQHWQESNLGFNKNSWQQTHQPCGTRDSVFNVIQSIASPGVLDNPVRAIVVVSVFWTKKKEARVELTLSQRELSSLQYHSARFQCPRVYK